VKTSLRIELFPGTSFGFLFALALFLAQGTIMRYFVNRLGMVLSFIFFIPSLIEATEFPFDYGGEHYIIESSGKMWLNAKTAAANHAAYLGQTGYLAIINSAAENTAVYNALISAGITTTAPDGGGVRYAWLGGTDSSSGYSQASEGEFYWINGIKFWTGGYGGHAMTGVYAKFGSGGEPDNYNGNQNFVGMGLDNWPVGSASQWNDVNGSNSLAYVIEFPVPEPGTWILLAMGLLVMGCRKIIKTCPWFD
jgi:hypothetical protein